MKRITFIFTMICLMFAAAGHSQVNRRIAPQQYRNSSPSKEQKKYDFVESSVEYYTKELKLDDFQAAAVRQVYESERDNIEALRESGEDVTTDEKKEKAYAITERIDAKVLKLLNPEQTKKFEELKAKRKTH
ncbi:hypothetical protein ACLI1A_12095 [Flavobacterium sp. RHBU_3]|uniref:hypothetical protein n=1 Tax=Flavobacterium sp. RHBU_3 TaxID=3391184 RepID=UPI003984F226